MTRFLFALSFLIVSASAQTASLEGTVRAEKRPVTLSGARITVRSHGTTVTSGDGSYAIRNLQPGPAQVIAEMAGFATVEKTVELKAGETVNLDWRLPLTDNKESVIVEGGLLSVRSDAPEHSQTINSQQLQDLPSNGRRVTRFALLDPHVRQAIGLGGDGPDSNRLSINASSYRNTAYLLDGTINFDWTLAVAPQQPVSVGATEQVKVLSGQYAAEFGTSTSGVIAVTTKSGGNEWHGEGIANIRPNPWQTQVPLAAASLPRVPNRREQWGGSVGGPIRKDATFLFVNYEGSHQERGAYIQSPTPSFFPGTIREQYALVKVDHRWNDHHWLTWRANGSVFAGDNVNDRVGGINQPNFGREARLQSHGSQLTQHSTYGNVLNEFSISYASYFPNSAFPLESSVGISRPGYSMEGNSTHSWTHARNYSIGDVIALRTGAHQWKAGLTYLRQSVKDYAFTPFGTYTFAAGPPTPGQTPLRYSQTFGEMNLRYGQSVAAGFIQDDFRMNNRLKANLGLRYEFQSLTQDRNNFAPRAGLAWDPTGSGNTVVRAGAGMFYDQFYLYVNRRFYSSAPNAPTATYTLPFGDPAFPTFPNSLTSPPQGLSSGRLDLIIPPEKLLNPYSFQYTLAVERKLAKGWTFTVDGLHSHVLKQYRVNDLNRPEPLIRTAPGQVRTAAQADAVRPYTSYLGVPVRLVALIENSSSSLYDSLTFSVRQMRSHLYQLDVHYTAASSASYSMFYADANSGIPNEWNNWGSAERAPSDFHQRHRVVANGTLHLPLRLQLSSVALFASGLPVNPLTGTDNNGDTYSVDRPVGFGRNSFRTPAQIQIDASLGRQFRFGEHVKLDARVEVYNVPNRTNLINVNNVYGEGPSPRATFMQPLAGITNTDPSRQIHLALRVFF